MPADPPHALSGNFARTFFKLETEKNDETRRPEAQIRGVSATRAPMLREATGAVGLAQRCLKRQLRRHKMDAKGKLLAHTRF